MLLKCHQRIKWSIVVIALIAGQLLVADYANAVMDGSSLAEFTRNKRLAKFAPGTEQIIQTASRSTGFGFSSLDVREQVIKVSGLALAGFSAFIGQPVRLIGIEVMIAALIVRGVLYENQPGHPLIEQRMQTRSEVLTHYQNIEDDQKYAMAEMLIDAMPDMDVYIVNSEFLIKNIDQKFARACVNAGLNPEAGGCRLQDLPSKFLYHILPYRSGGETQQEMQIEVLERLAESHSSAQKSQFNREEWFCNIQRWNGYPCAVQWDLVSRRKVAFGEGFSNTLKDNKRLKKLPLEYNFFNKFNRNNPVPYSADRQMGERSSYVFSPANLVKIDLEEGVSEETMICHVWKRVVRSYLRIPPHTRYVRLEKREGKYFQVLPVNDAAARCDKDSKGYLIKVDDEDLESTTEP